jgi:hypothetical protein
LLLYFSPSLCCDDPLKPPSGGAAPALVSPQRSIFTTPDPPPPGYSLAGRLPAIPPLFSATPPASPPAGGDGTAGPGSTTPGGSAPTRTDPAAPTGEQDTTSGQAVRPVDPVGTPGGWFAGMAEERDGRERPRPADLGIGTPLSAMVGVPVPGLAVPPTPPAPSEPVVSPSPQRDRLATQPPVTTTPPPATRPRVTAPAPRDQGIPAAARGKQPDPTPASIDPLLLLLSGLVLVLITWRLLGDPRRSKGGSGRHAVPEEDEVEPLDLERLAA